MSAITRIERHLTRDQAIEIYERLHKVCSRGNGYQPYGWDWPTLYAIWPAKAQVMRRLLRAARAWCLEYEKGTKA